MIGRIAACAGLFVLSALLVGQWGGVASAQNKDTKRENMLEKQVKSLQQDLLQAGRLNAALKQDVNQLNAANNKLETANNQLQAALKKDEEGR